MNNPLDNPIFYSVVFRLLIIYSLGFLLILKLNRFKLGGIWDTNVGKRYLSWMVIGPIYLAAVFLGGYPSLLVLVIILLLAIREVQKISNLPKPYIIALYVLSPLSVLVADSYPAYFYSLPLIYYLAFSMIVVRQNDAKNGLFNISLSMFVSIWIIFSLTHFILLGRLNNQLDSTRSLLVLIGFAVPLSDISAYVVGRFFHKIKFLDEYKIASNLSSKKTYIGTLGNILGAGLGIGIMYFAISGYLPWYHWVILSIIIGVMDVFGDITESMFKRYFNVKDSGHLIPGHGGILDRIDSTLRVIVIAYYYILFFV